MPSLSNQQISITHEEIIPSTMSFSELKYQMPFKPRRPHKKSRAGCFRCKKEKRKCDERSPRCTRCEKRNVECQKPEIKRARSPQEPIDSPITVFPDRDDSSFIPFAPDSNVVDTYSHSTSSTNDSVSLDEEVFLPPFREVDEWGLGQEYMNVSGFSQLELFEYYLEHTSLSVAADQEDLYALRAGIGRLAYDSSMLMNSICALAAVHKCHDMLERPVLSSSQWSEVTNLLLSAEQYHWRALQETQTNATHVSHYGHVMANAALMVLYSCASHSVHIRLTGKGSHDMGIPAELIPVHLQWASMVRAIQVAYSGLVNSKQDPLKVDISTHLSLMEIRPAGQSPQQEHQHQLVPSGENGPTKRTQELFLPIVDATWANAFDRLRRVALATVDIDQDPSSGEQYATHCSQWCEKSSVSDFHVCIRALNLLYDIFSEAFAADPSLGFSEVNIEEHQASECPTDLDGLSEMEPWLRSYLARVTCKTQHKPLRRTIMSFIHRLPARFLDLVHEAMDHHNPSMQHTEVDLATLKLHKLVVEIFAHWLVLVMLLDGVWWIGDIGAWELKRAISTARDLSQSDSTDIEANWWPKSMYNIKEEMRNI
ncbi:putative Zn(2)-C6 fungal-type domain-containing protein [Seiridium cardinale]